MIGTAISFNGFTINDRASQPLLHAQSPYYYVMVKNVDGLRNADISYESHPLPYIAGEKSGDVFRRGKTVTLSGYVYGLGLSTLEQGCDVLQQMFADTGIHQLAWTRRSDGVGVYLNCRVNQDLSIIESFDDLNHRWPWVVGLRADKPFTYAQSGGALYPAWQE